MAPETPNRSEIRNDFDIILSNVFQDRLQLIFNDLNITSLDMYRETQALYNYFALLRANHSNSNTVWHRLRQLIYK